MTVLSLALIACIVLIAFAPIIAGAIAGAIALSEFKRPLMIYFIADGVLGILRTVGLGMQYKLERMDDNRDLIEDYNIFTCGNLSNKPSSVSMFLLLFTVE